MKRSFALAALLAVLAAPDAHAYEPGTIQDAGAHQRPQMLSFFLGLPYGYGGCGFFNGPGGCGFPVGLSVRYYIPILHEGFIPPANDSFGIEFGADLALYTRNGYFFLGIPVEARWDFHFHQKFQAYVKAGLGLGIHGGPNNGYAGIYFTTGLGLLFHITESVSLRAEAGFPWVKLGVGFAF